MAPRVDFGKLWQQIENPITIVLRKKSGRTFTPYDVTYARQMYAPGVSVVGEDIILDETTTIFHMWKDKLDIVQAGLRPENGDEIWVLTSKNPGNESVVNDKKFIIDTVRRQSHGERFRCVCREHVS